MTDLIETILEALAKTELLARYSKLSFCAKQRLSIPVDFA